jgi:ABC-type Fe3+-siderophore transport system permease subunit
MNEGGAIIAHSGGAFGLALGAITDLAVRGKTNVTPADGMGIGAISGVVAAGALARFTPEQAPSRVLFIDLSAALGALGGAALASPLVFGKHVDATRSRLWLSSIALGTFAGAAVGYFTTTSSKPAREPAEKASVSPFVGVIAEEPRPGGRTAPVTGAGVQGVF